MFRKHIGRAGGMAMVAVALSPLLLGCPNNPGPGPGPLAQTLYVGHDGVLVSYDIATGAERPGTVTSYASPTDIQALDDGTIVVNLTNDNSIVAINGETMLEVARVSSSATGGTRPVHSFITPLRSGKQYWVAMNDGTGGGPATNKAAFFGGQPAAGDFMQLKGEVGLGIGHHKGSFSSATERFVASNIGDCDTVLGVYDYSDVANIQTLVTWSSADLGWNGTDPGADQFDPRYCDLTFTRGLPPSPHGCATSKLSGKAYCNLTGSGELVAVAIDASPPTFTKISTTGSGGGYTKASHDGRYIYSVQEKPREGDGGVNCQIGQLVVIDAQDDSVASQTPLLYEGPSCTRTLATDEDTNGPGHIQLSKTGTTLYVTPAGGFEDADARVRQELVLDLTDPAHPVQLASIPIGTGTSHIGDALSGDGKYLFTANNVDNTVTQIDTATNTVVRTFNVRATPRVVTTFGDAEGPAHQTGPID